MWNLWCQICGGDWTALLQQKKSAPEGYKEQKGDKWFLFPHEEEQGHQIEWGKCVFLDKEKNWRRRKIKEAIYINAINPTESMVHQDILNLEKGYDFDPIWGGFNQDFRGIIEKRIQSAKV